MFRFITYFMVAVALLATVAAEPKDGWVAVLVISVMAGAIIWLFRRHTDEKDFVTYIFLAALAVRLVFGAIIHTYDLREFAGPDSFSYDLIGIQISDYWSGTAQWGDPELARVMSIRGPGWGMNYLMGFIYLVTGQSILIAQSFCIVIGAAAVPMVYYCAWRIYDNKRVARAASICVAFFPAFIIWSSQLLKDGLILFLLVLAMAMVLQIQRKFSVSALILLIGSMGAILSLRFYIFYMLATAVVGSFVVGVNTSFRAILQRTAILVVVGLTLTYVGVVRVASTDLQNYGSLERVQITRLDLRQSARSGYGEDVDVSTLGGAIGAIPIGFVYLMFAPFPWEMKNLRQSLTLPDVLLWWAMFPFIIYGAWYTLRHRLRPAFPALIFSFLLTISYSVFQGNVGAAYRQRTQIQVFLFMFVAVTWGVIRERFEDKRLIEDARRRQVIDRLRYRATQV